MKWIIVTLKCRSLFKLSMKIESYINLPLMRRKKSKLTPSELSRKKLLILLTWWIKCPVFWYKTTKTLTTQEPWSMTLDTFSTAKKNKKRKSTRVKSVLMKKSTELCQISTLLEDHHSTRSRLFKSNSTLLFLTLVTIIWRSALNLPKRLTIWRSAWFQHRRQAVMKRTIKWSKLGTLLFKMKNNEWFTVCYLKSQDIILYQTLRC